MLLKYNHKHKKWNHIDESNKDSDCIYLDGKLKEKLDNIKMILKKNWDCFFIIDGMEGSGKSTLGLTCAWYLSDTKFTVNNICKSAKEAIEKMSSFPEESVLIIDEGDLMFSSKDVFNTEQKLLINLTKVIRFRRLVLIIIAPSFFDLNRGISERRSKFLLHVYTDKKLTRGRFAYFGSRKKHLLYEMGKKNYNSYDKPHSDFVGTFTDFKMMNYIETKNDIVNLMVETSKESRYKTQRDFLLAYFKKKDKLTYEELVNIMKSCQYPLEIRQISKEINKIRHFGVQL